MSPFKNFTIVIFVVLSGCSAEPGHMNYLSEPNLPITGRIDKAPENTLAESLGSNVLAFGRIRWIENDQERTEYRSGWGWNVWMRYYRNSPENSGLFVVEKDGRFTWRIPRGSYILYQIGWREASIGLQYLVPNVAFEAQGNPNALCLGTLVIRITSKRDLTGGHWLRNAQVQIDDDCTLLEEQFRSHYKDSKFITGKSLIRFDENLQIPEYLEAQNRLTGVIRALNPNLMLGH